MFLAGSFSERKVKLAPIRDVPVGPPVEFIPERDGRKVGREKAVAASGDPDTRSTL